MMARDLLILSNGPGEISTWVRPVVKALRAQEGGDRLRISVVLSPCANASGREADMARQIPGVDRVQAAQHFFPFLLMGKTADNWDWHPQGVVLFLGGDQVFPVVIGRRLGYGTVVYAEWDARWHRWIHRFACMTPAIVEAAPPQFQHKCQVIGDLMADVDRDGAVALAVRDRLQLTPDQDLIGLLPGSKANKLSMGLPLAIATAAAIHQQRPQTQFVIPVAPLLSLEALSQFADAAQNPDVHLFPGSPTAYLVTTDPDRPYLQIPHGPVIHLWQTHPAYDLLAQCRFCLTTVGANTAELGSLGVPMMVLLPTQKLEAMKAWDGIPGLLANLPWVGNALAKGMNAVILRQIYREGRLFAWPNIWAKREIVPERIGPLQPQTIAAEVVNYLDHPETLGTIQENLRSVRGEAGAAAKLAAMVLAELERATAPS